MIRTTILTFAVIFSIFPLSAGEKKNEKKVETVFGEACGKEGSDYIEARKEFMAKGGALSFLEKTKALECGRYGYIDLMRDILLERINKKAEIEKLENIPWGNDEEVQKLLAEYSSVPAERELTGGKSDYPASRLKEEILKQYLINHAKKSGLKFYFVEGFLKKLDFQDCKFYPVGKFALIKKDFIRDFLATLDEESKEEMLKSVNLDYSHYLAPLFAIGNEKYLAPIIEHQLNLDLKQDDIMYDYLPYLKSTGSIDHMLAYYAKHRTDDDFRYNMFLISSGIPEKMQKFYNDCDWNKKNDFGFSKELHSKESEQLRKSMKGLVPAEGNLTFDEKLKFLIDMKKAEKKSDYYTGRLNMKSDNFYRHQLPKIYPDLKQFDSFIAPSK